MGVTIRQLLELKHARPLVAVTAWDWSIARLVDAAGVDLVLVGDSLAMVALGHAHTLPVTLDAMVHHAAAVVRGTDRALVVCDLPFLSFQEGAVQALRAAGRVLKEAGAQAVKLEGGTPETVETVRRLVSAGIPVMGHVGLTPQSVHALGYRQQGNTPEDADRILREATALAEAGVFAIVLEHIPAELAAKISASLPVLTVGIGAGPDCDGQVLVTADLLGLSPKLPPFAKRYANLGEVATAAVQQYAADVRSGQFPARSQ